MLLFHAHIKFCVFFSGTMYETIFFVVQLVQRKYLWRFYISKWNSAVSFSQIEPKLAYLAIGRTQLNARASSDAVEKPKRLSRTRWYKNCYNFFSLYIFALKLCRILCNRYSNCLCDFYVFTIFGIGVMTFQSQKTTKAPLFRVVFTQNTTLKKLEKFLNLFFVNYTMWLML